jgi:hypothetical protein
MKSSYDLVMANMPERLLKSFNKRIAKMKEEFEDQEVSF